MRRRIFLKTSGLLAAGTALAARGLSQISIQRPRRMILLCIIGGGARNRETIWMDSGNLMPALLSGDLRTSSKILSPELRPASVKLYSNVWVDSPELNHHSSFWTLASGAPYCKGTDPLRALHRYFSSVWLVNPVTSDFDESLEANLDRRSTRSILSTRGHGIRRFGSGDSGINNSLELALAGIKRFRPEIAIVRLPGADVAHYDFTAYCKFLSSWSTEISSVWKRIQADPELREQMVMVAASEMGRNSYENEIADQHGRFGLDHSDPDGEARTSFCMMLSPSNGSHREILITDSVPSSQLLGEILAAHSEIQ
jgi:hypothetical protein